MNPIERLKTWVAERTGYSRQQLDAMDALDNQPLKAAWLEYCKHWAQAKAWGQVTPWKAFGLWHQTVLAAYGPDIGIAMDEDGCRLSNGQFYPYPKE